MRIRSMDVNGFGVFDGKRFELNAPVVLFYGENEAGKSTLLQFVRSMLFGFPTRAQADARYEPVRGGRYGGSLQLEFDDGSTFRLERYADQGRAAKLIFPDGTIAGEKVLRERLSGMTSQMFRHLFAFGLTELQQLQTLQTEEAGQFLFSTGFGADTSRLLKAEKKLEQEMDQLFRPKGKNQTMYQLAERLEAAHQELSNSYSAQDEYNQVIRELEANQAEIERLEQTLNGHLLRSDQLQAAIGLRDRWMRSEEIENEWKTLPDVSTFSLDALAKWDKLAERVIQKEEERSSAAWKLKQHVEKERVLTVNDELLRHREALETLWAGLGVYRENKERLQAILTDISFKQQALERQLVQMDDSWTIDDLAAFPVSIAERKQVADFRDQLSLIERETIRLQDTLARLSEREKTERRERDALRLACDEREQTLADRLAQITPLSYPAFQTKAEQYIERMHSYKEQKKQLELEKQRLQDAVETLHWLGEAPVTMSRRSAQRHKGMNKAVLAVTLSLQFVLPGACWLLDQPTAAWITFALLAGFHLSLMTRTKSSLTSASSSADNDPTKRTSIEQKMKELEQGIEKRERKYAEIRNDLEQILKEILHPDREAAAGAARLIPSDLSKRIDTTTDEVDDLFEQWHIILEKELDVLSRMVANVDDAVQQAELQQLRYIEAKTDLESQEKHAQEARSELEMLQSSWRQWADSRQLSPTLSPDTVLEMFRSIEQAKNMLLDIQQKTSESERLKQEIAAFEEKAATLLQFQSPDELPALLRQRRDEAQAEAERKLERQAWEERMHELKEEQAQIEVELKSLIEQQQLVLQSAGAADENDLRAKHQTYERKQRLQEEAQQLKLMLDTWNSLGTKKELELILQTYGPDQLQHELQKHREEAESLKNELNDLKKQFGALTLKKDQLIGGKEHHDRLQSVEDMREQVIQTAEQWAVRALSYALIQKTKAIVEQQRQPRVLHKASGYFSAMTNGSYERITVPAFEKKIMAVRQDGEQVESSRLSRGTAEQLYLSMRFALAEEYARHVRLPIVLDDIFVNFDDGRMQRTLSILKEISQKNQVLMFTCHRHVRDAVEKIIPDRHEVVLRKRQ